MRRYKGNTPCPGCKRSAAEATRFALMELCSECSKFLRRGRNQKDDAAEFVRVDWSKNAGHESWFTAKIEQGKRNDADRSGSIRYLSERDNDAGTPRGVLNAIGDVIAALDRGECEVSATLKLTESYRDTFYISSRSAAAIFELHKAIAEYSRGLYAEGFRDGNNLIVGLAAGTHTIDDANETAARIAKYGSKKP